MPLEDRCSRVQEAWRELDLQNGIKGNSRLLRAVFSGQRSTIRIINSSAATEPKPSRQLCEGWSS